jgi:hypothetical protein
LVCLGIFVVNEANQKPLSDISEQFSLKNGFFRELRDQSINDSQVTSSLVVYIDIFRIVQAIRNLIINVRFSP